MGMLANTLEAQYLISFVCIGEQSVGKSFALNHLCDTSFAGAFYLEAEAKRRSI